MVAITVTRPKCIHARVTILATIYMVVITVTRPRMQSRSSDCDNLLHIYVVAITVTRPRMHSGSIYYPNYHIYGGYHSHSTQNAFTIE